MAFQPQYGSPDQWDQKGEPLSPLSQRRLSILLSCALIIDVYGDRIGCFLQFSRPNCAVDWKARRNWSPLVESSCIAWARQPDQHRSEESWLVILVWTPLSNQDNQSTLLWPMLIRFPRPRCGWWFRQRWSMSPYFSIDSAIWTCMLKKTPNSVPIDTPE